MHPMANERQNSKPAATDRLRPIVALKALKRLIDDPERTEQVFVVIRAMSGDSLQRGFQRFRQTAVGRRVLSDAGQPSLLDHLSDRDALRRLPVGSLGRAYLVFVEQEQITADGLVEASEHEQRIADPALARFAARQRDMHDLWHVCTGYGRDTFGEDCLLGFTYAQGRNRGIGLICLAGAFKIRQVLGRGVFRAVYKAYRAGCRAEWLPAADWEALLPQPLESVREQLKIEPPQEYRELLERAGYAAASAG